MPTTSNFGWTTPADTDLVKDGAAAIRTLGNGIDTSFLDLKGGTSGQVLSKASNTDLDFTWVAQDDSNAIQNAIVDAKGDLISATAADTPARLAVGANGTVLTADSAEATGLKWAAPASASTFVGCSVRGAATLIANNTTTVLDYTVETFDTSNFHSNTTNPSRITIPAGKAGYYLIIAKVEWNTNAGGNNRQVRLNLNGTNIKNNIMAPDGDSPGPQVQTIRNLAEADYLTVSVFQDSGADLDVYPTATQEFSIAYIGAA